MADFVETNNTKSALRELAVPIATIAAFDAIIESVLADNPFLCVDYVEQGATIPGVKKNRESYTVKVNYEDDYAKTVGSISAKAPTVAAFGTLATQIMGNAALATAMGGDAVRDGDHEAFSCQLKCRDANGETYYVTFSRKNVRISSYQDDGIRTRVETWADGVVALE